MVRETAPSAVAGEQQAGPCRDRGRIVVVVPAHNEAAGIGETLTSLSGQSRLPDRVIVVPDNCTDATAQIAAAHGAETVPTVGNTDKKAGALNFVLAGLLPGLDAEDMVLVQDADSQLSTDFIENAARQLLAYDLRI